MIVADNSYKLIACHYISEQLTKLCKELKGSREAKDSEHVHQSRVASRRIRAALAIFDNCFPEKKIKKWRKEIKSLTQGFGPARDADVQIEYLKKVLSRPIEQKKEFSPGINRLLLRTIQHRQKVQSDVIKTIDALESGFVLADIHASVEKILFYFRNKDLSVKSQFVFGQTAQQINKRIQKLLSYQNCLKNPSNKEQHHQMRIAAKKLRYTMEICQEPYENRLDNAIKTVKKLQTILGDIHDCDVWVDRITEFMKTEFQLTKEYFGSDKPYYLLIPGLEYLIKEQRQQREKLFKELVGFWQKLLNEKFWYDLIKKLKEPQIIPYKSNIEIKEIQRPQVKNVQDHTIIRGCSRESTGIRSSS
jgi:CHAD domain-containing protein